MKNKWKHCIQSKLKVDYNICKIATNNVTLRIKNAKLMERIWTMTNAKTIRVMK